MRALTSARVVSAARGVADGVEEKCGVGLREGEAVPVDALGEAEAAGAEPASDGPQAAVRMMRGASVIATRDLCMV